MRDRRGEETRLGDEDPRLLMVWVADCAEHVLSYFEEKHPGDGHPRRAVDAGRAWARGETELGDVRAAAFAAHAADGWR